MDSNEEYFYNKFLSENGEWSFFAVGDGEKAQAKEYDPPAWVSYPDFEKRVNGKLVLLLELKSYRGWYDDAENVLGLLERHYRHYFVVQRKEKVDVMLVFVIKNENGCRSYFWSALNDTNRFNGWIGYNREGKKCKYFYKHYFRTDIENIGDD